MNSNIVWANLLGTWHNLEKEDPNCVMGIHRKNPSTWWEENADIWAPNTMEKEHSMYQLPHVLIAFQGHAYRISPLDIQIIDES